MLQAIADIKICCIFALAKRKRPLLKGVSVKQKIEYWCVSSVG